MKGTWGDETDVSSAIVANAKKNTVWDCVEKCRLNMDPYLFDHWGKDTAKFCVVTELKRLNI